MNLFKSIFTKDISIKILFLFLSLIIYLRYRISFIPMEYIILTLFLLKVALEDIKTMEIPDKINIAGFIIAVIFLFIKVFFYHDNISSYLFGFLAGGGFFLIIALLTKGAMGGGDIKLMAVLGLWLGLENILLITILSFFIAAIISVILLITKKKKKKDYIPFGPFIAIAAYLTVLCGSEIWNFII